MKKADVQCPDCRAAYRRIELISRKGHAGAYRCLIWAGFAKRGIGTGATDNGGDPNNLNVVESFAVPAQCTPQCGDALLQVGEECDDGANGDPDDGCSDACQVIPEPEQTLMLFAGAAALSLLDRRRARRMTVAR